MPKRAVVAFLMCGALLVQLARPMSSFAAEGERGPAPSKVCTTHKTSSPYRNLGYEHVVTFENTCDHTERCVIKASSNPDPVTVDVPAGNTQSVVVRRGSAARDFTVAVACKKK